MITTISPAKQKLGVHGACAKLVTIMTTLLHSRRSIRFVLMLLVVFQVGCSVYSEHSHSQTGTFYPNGCVKIDGFKMDIMDTFVGATICDPVRIVSFGTMRPGLSTQYSDQPFEGARLSFDVGDVVVSHEGLKRLGRIEYQPHQRSVADYVPSIRNLAASGVNIVLVIVLVILMLCAAIKVGSS